ncbi:hypothetical protein PCH70_38630 [Pseudomonas cichorii JBC1]|nr:hypothetical protein PCH70_38630 [Pseudomonas cichorii JBC1]
MTTGIALAYLSTLLTGPLIIVVLHFQTIEAPFIFTAVHA